MAGYIVIDIATAPLEGAVAFLPPVKAPKTYKDAEKIAAYEAEARAEQLESIACDVDLCQISGVGWQCIDGAGELGGIGVITREDHSEYAILHHLSALADRRRVVTFNGATFDLPIIHRRALDLHYELCPVLNKPYEAPWKSENIDVFAELTNNGRAGKGKSLQFYAKRYGLAKGLTKTLSGAEESQVLQTQKWAELRESLTHDVAALTDLALFARVFR